MSKFTPNSFQVPNAFVDEVLNKISDASCKLYLVVCRKTRGWQKQMDSISLTQFEKITGKSRPTVVKCVRELVKVGLLIELHHTFHGKTYKLGDETNVGLVVRFPSKDFLLDASQLDASKDFLPLLVKNFNHASKEFLPLLVKNFNHASKEFLPLLVKNFYTQKQLSKTTIQNKKINKKSDGGCGSEKSTSEKPEIKNSFDPKNTNLPENVNRETWIDFVDMRTGLKKPLTENAVKLLLKKLAGYGELANQSLETSIIGNYTGIYQPKTNQQGNQRSGYSKQAPNTNRNVNGAWDNHPQFSGEVGNVDIPEDFV